MLATDPDTVPAADTSLGDYLGLTIYDADRFRRALAHTGITNATSLADCVDQPDISRFTHRYKTPVFIVLSGDRHVNKEELCGITV
jgi:hypothetical protein